tara:strand:- start:53 stop:340 length:288 start_codon:yes stop_codon:yes gene_type:complete
MNPRQRFSLVSQGDPTVHQSRILFDVYDLPVMKSPLNGWAFGSGRFLLSGFALNMKLDLLLLLNNDDETFSTHTITETTSMTRITFTLATALCHN